MDLDVKSLSDQELTNVIGQLRGSKYLKIQLKAQRELVERARQAGLTTQRLVDKLIFGSPREKRHEIAKEWAQALEITEREFIRLASGK